MPLNQWTRITFTLDSGTGRLYRDGTLISTATGMGNAVPSDGPLRIGGNTIWSGEGFDGAVDEVRVWPVALSPSEIAQTAMGAARAGKAAGTSTTTTAKKAPACSKTSTRRHHRIVRKACKKTG
jgi:hypothetical protein